MKMWSMYTMGFYFAGKKNEKNEIIDLQGNK